MAMLGNYSTQGINQAPAQIKPSRINADMERVLSMARTVNSARDRVCRYSSALGYFSDSPEQPGEGSKVQPISNNMQSALNDLERSLESLHGALSMFD